MRSNQRYTVQRRRELKRERVCLTECKIKSDIFSKRLFLRFAKSITGAVSREITGQRRQISLPFPFQQSTRSVRCCLNIQ